MRKAMRIQGWLALILVMLGLADPATAAEFDPFGLESTKLSREGLYTGAGAPDIGLTRDCNDNGDCWDVIRNGRGHTLERFGRDDSVAQLARARYKDRAFLLVDRAYDCGDDRCEEVVLYDQGGREVEVNKKFRKRFQDGGLDLFDLDEPLLLDLTVTKPGGLLALTSKGLVYMDREGKVQNRVQAPVRLTHGRIQNDLGGRQAAIGVGANNAVWLSNGKQWDAGGLRLAEHGDRKGVLSVQPEGDGSTVGAVYRYVNPYNKGLFLVRARPGEESPQSGPVLLSTVRNVGFDPEILPERSGYLVLASDSSNDRRVQVEVPRDALKEMPHPAPGKFPQGEWRTTFWLGGGGQYQNWVAHSQVRKDQQTYLKVDYQIHRTMLWTAQFQGRVGDTRVALTYLKDRARDAADNAAGNRATKEASEYLIGSIDFQRLFSKSSGLRVAYRKSRTEGLAKLQDPQQQTTSYQPFTVDYSQFGLYQTLERGEYWGLEYTDYQMPSAVGFSDASKDIVYSDFDPHFGIQKWALVAGYDPQAYAKRYETDYIDWYLAGKAGLGLGKADLSSDVEHAAKQQTGKKKINTPTFLAVDAMLEAGYLWQKRYRTARGLGYQILVGYRAMGSYMGAGQGKDAKRRDGLSLEFSRYDLWHGPFARLNVIF